MEVHRNLWWRWCSPAPACLTLPFASWYSCSQMWRVFLEVIYAKNKLLKNKKKMKGLFPASLQNKIYSESSCLILGCFMQLSNGLKFLLSGIKFQVSRGQQHSACIQMIIDNLHELLKMTSVTPVFHLQETWYEDTFVTWLFLFWELKWFVGPSVRAGYLSTIKVCMGLPKSSADKEWSGFENFAPLLLSIW